MQEKKEKTDGCHCFPCQSQDEKVTYKIKGNKEELESEHSAFVFFNKGDQKKNYLKEFLEAAVGKGKYFRLKFRN